MPMNSRQIRTAKRLAAMASAASTATSYEVDLSREVETEFGTWYPVTAKAIGEFREDSISMDLPTEWDYFLKAVAGEWAGKFPKPKAE